MITSILCLVIGIIIGIVITIVAMNLATMEMFRGKW